MSKHIIVEVEPESRLTEVVKASAPDSDGLIAVIDGRRFRMVEETQSDYWATTTISDHFAKFRISLSDSLSAATTLAGRLASSGAVAAFLAKCGVAS